MYKESKLLPRNNGLPYTMQDILIEQLARDEAMLYKPKPNPLPPPEPRIPLIRRTAQAANWTAANVLRFSVSLVRP